MDPVTGLSRRATLAAVVLVLVGIGAGGIATVGGAQPGCPDAEYDCAAFEEGEPVVLGALFPDVDDASARAVELAVELHGTLAGRPVEVAAYSDGCDAGRAAGGARELATDAPDEPPVVAVVGATCSTTAAPAAQILSDSGITLVTWSGAPVSFRDPRRSFLARPALGSPTPRFERSFAERYGHPPETSIAWLAFSAARKILQAADALAVGGGHGRLLVPRLALHREITRP